MKVISGKYKGRKLLGFDIKGTRPTMDRVKESLFSMIQDYVKEGVVLDLYSGTGNLAIETLSNGAEKAYMVDNNKIAIDTINSNLKTLNIDNAVVIKGLAKNILNDFIIKKQVFDIIFLDPPYLTNEINETLHMINENMDILSEKGIIICETEVDVDYSQFNNLSIKKYKKYGLKKVNIVQKKIITPYNID